MKVTVVGSPQEVWGGDAVTYTSAETYSSTLGLNDVFESSSVFYANNALHLSGQLGQTDIMVYDVYGRRVYQGQENIQGAVRKSLPLAENVVHFVVLETENKRKTFKVIPH